MHNSEITLCNSENRQFIKNSIGCKDQMFLVYMQRKFNKNLELAEEFDIRLTRKQGILCDITWTSMVHELL